MTCPRPYNLLERQPGFAPRWSDSRAQARSHPTVLAPQGYRWEVWGLRNVTIVHLPLWASCIILSTDDRVSYVPSSLTLNIRMLPGSLLGLFSANSKTQALDPFGQPHWGLDNILDYLCGKMHINTQVSIGHREPQNSSKARTGVPGWDLMLSHAEITSRESKDPNVKDKAIRKLE